MIEKLDLTVLRRSVHSILYVERRASKERLLRSYTKVAPGGSCSPSLWTLGDLSRTPPPPWSSSLSSSSSCRPFGRLAVTVVVFVEGERLISWMDVDALTSLNRKFGKKGVNILEVATVTATAATAAATTAVVRGIQFLPGLSLSSVYNSFFLLYSSLSLLSHLSPVASESSLFF